MKVKLKFKVRAMKNVMRCPFCGAGIVTLSNDRRCYKCDKQMFMEGKIDAR